MSYWKIRPGGLKTLLTSAANEQAELAKALKEEEFESIFNGLMWGGNFTAVVPQAVSAMLKDQQANLSSVSNRMVAGIQGVANAARTYKLGQEEMAGRFESEMVRAADTGEFEFFKKHGYKGES